MTGVHITIRKEDDGYRVHLTDLLSVGGFADLPSAAIWTQEYIFRMMRQSLDADTRRQMLGAAILAAVPGKENS